MCLALPIGIIGSNFTSEWMAFKRREATASKRVDSPPEVVRLEKLIGGAQEDLESVVKVFASTSRKLDEGQDALRDRMRLQARELDGGRVAIAGALLMAPSAADELQAPAAGLLAHSASGGIGSRGGRRDGDAPPIVDPAAQRRADEFAELKAQMKELDKTTAVMRDAVRADGRGEEGAG